MNKRQQTGTPLHISDDVQQLVGFTIGKNLFGADIASVQEILHSAPLIEMPNAPDYVEGLMKLRGRIFPLINLRKKLGLKAENTTESSRVIVIEIRGMLTGIRVDTVTGVLECNPQNIVEAAGEFDSNIDPMFCSGMCQDDDTKIILPDFDNIFMIDD